MSTYLEHEDLEDFAGQFFDVSINPLAEVLTKLLHLLISKGVITKEEAVLTLASSVGVISQTDHSEAVKENGANMLMRMIQAIDPAR
ncbi:MAG TPA: hypothetical protein VK614_12425 [Allosphingosinicella sp.]|nr:hypothetical protein [Allosphingosinicella sp.]